MTRTAADLNFPEQEFTAGHTRLRELAGESVFTVFQRLASSPRGLTEA